MRLAIPTKGKLGLKDSVSEVFGKAPTFTILDWDGWPNIIEVLDNPGVSMSQGSGPIAIKLLNDKGVKMLLCGKVGVGVSTMLNGFGIKHVKVEPNTRVSDAVTVIDDLWKI